MDKQPETELLPVTQADRDATAHAGDVGTRASDLGVVEAAKALLALPYSKITKRESELRRALRNAIDSHELLVDANSWYSQGQIEEMQRRNEHSPLLCSKKAHQKQLACAHAEKLRLFYGRFCQQNHGGNETALKAAVREFLANCARSSTAALRQPTPASAPDGTAVEFFNNDEPMICIGCGTTKTLVHIRKTPGAISCCPERKMVPVSEFWQSASKAPASAPDAASAEALKHHYDELQGSDFEAVREHSKALWNALTTPKPNDAWREALEALLNTSGARGTYHALKHADAVVNAERLLSITPAAPAPDTQKLIEALEGAIRHIEHMAAYIRRANTGYSFESIGEDMPAIKAALASIKEDGRG